MRINGQTLTFRLSVLLLAGVLLIGGATTYGYLTLSRIIGVYDLALNRQVASERAVLMLEIAFKEQVQEWKNVLLRGFKTDDLSKYWGKFEAKEEQIQQDGQALLAQLTHQKAKSLLEKFLDSHRYMGDQYRKGLDQFRDSGFDPATGDRSVRGIDREPTQMLSQAAAELTNEVFLRTNQLKQDGNEIILISILLSVISILAIVILSIWTVRRVIIRPTREISAGLNRLAGGDFSNDHAAYAYTAGELGLIFEDIQRVKQHLGGVIQNVRGSTIDLSESATEFSHVIQRTQNHLQQQQGDIHQVATAMHEMTTVVSQVSSNAENAAISAKDADQATRDGLKVVEETISSIDHLAQNVGSASDVIQRLEGDVENIGQVLDVIRGIAEQTNLLALNAAIEAARAGEQGRGFAVVADEVRTLAGRTQESTQEIQEMIEKLEEGTAKAVTAMLESRERAQVSVGQAAVAGDALRTIAQAVAAISEMNQQIAVGSTQQMAVTEEIHQSITNISQLSNHTGEEMLSLMAAGERVAGQARQMDMQVSQFSV